MKSCVFCGSGNLTKEHVWPQWLRKYSGPASFIERSGRYQETYKRTVVRQDADGEIFRTTEKRGNRTPNLHEVQVKCVCAKCNNGWMSKMESKVRPILEKLIELKSINLNRDQLKLLSSWAFKCFLMYDQYLPERDRVYSESDYTNFMLNRSPNSGSRIYMGWADNPWSTIAMWHEPQLLIPPESNDFGALKARNNLASSYLAVQRVYFIQHYYSKDIKWNQEAREYLYHEPIRMITQAPVLELHPMPKISEWPIRQTSFLELEASRLALLNRMNDLPSLANKLPFK